MHASYALAARGFETIMVNCNPETVSTDYDTSDRLYFEPLTYEDVMDVIDVERPDGVVVTLGGQTPLKLARMLEESGVNIMGTKPDAIDFAEDRERFAALLDKLGIMYPPAGQATSFEEAEAVAAHIGYPLLVRPSYVLGGRGMMIAYDAEHLRDYMAEAARISPDYPVYLDRFLEGAIESDVDALCDGEEVYIGGILEHIEEAGIHSGDSATCIPPFSFSESLQAKLRETTRRHRDGAGRARPGQRAVRHQGRDRLRDRGQPACQPHRAVYLQGHRRAAGQVRGAYHGGRFHRKPGPAERRASAGLVLHEGSRYALGPFPGRRRYPGARDEVDGRGHGYRQELSRGIRQDATGD